ncbi:MAG: hypothetical protein ABIA78_03240 [archaeon]
MAHLKRHKIPKTWPIARKGTTFVVRPNFALDRGMPLLVLLRDVLKVAQNRKEVKMVIHAKNILVNNKEARNDKNNVVLFDTIAIVPSEKYYRLGMSDKGKFRLDEIEEKEINNKVSKIVDKKVLRGKKTQLNLSDGMNFITDVKCNVGDSVLINFKDKKVEKCLPLIEKTQVFVFAGKHAGKEGVLRKLKPERKMASITVGDENINVLIKQLMVVEK